MHKSLVVLVVLVNAGCMVSFPESLLQDGAGTDDAGGDLSVRDQGRDAFPVVADGPHPDRLPGPDTRLPPDGPSVDVPTGCPAVCKNNCSGGICDVECGTGCVCPAGFACVVNCGNGGCNGPITCASGQCVVNCGNGGCNDDIDCSSACGCSVACGKGGCQGSITCPLACSACLDTSGCDNCP